MLDETEFLSPHGVRSVSRYHLDHPYEIELSGQKFTLAYEPGEGETRIYGGNSNWRGPVWAPINFLLIQIAAQTSSLLSATSSASNARPARRII